MTLRPASSVFARFAAIAVLAVAATHVSAAGASAGASTGTDAEYKYAVTLYKQARWAGAYGRFAHLADRGHPEAARIALFMLRYGTDLYGSAWSASQDQIDSWVHLASRHPVGLVSINGD